MDIFTQVNLDKYTLCNRLARSATAERGADEKGSVTDELVEMYRCLAKGGVGLIMTGHAFVRMDGRTNFAMTGTHSDDMIPGLSKLASIVHKNSDAKVFLQINHAGRTASEELTGAKPIAPSPIPIRLSGQEVRQLSGDEIEELIQCYVQAALRGREAGFDGVQLHCAHGYLISQFLSAYTNKREDEWGGSSENRRRFLLEIVSAIQHEAGDFPITVKINCEDMVPGGVEIEEFIKTCRKLERLAISGIEVSAGIPESASKIIRKNIDEADKEGYFIHGARALKEAGLKIPVMVVGGFRSKQVCQGTLDKGFADIISMSRPFITEPDLPLKWRKGQSDKSRCVSCNGCLKLRHEITHCVYWEKKESA